jgi:hypothetical protein
VSATAASSTSSKEPKPGRNQNDPQNGMDNYPEDGGDHNDDDGYKDVKQHEQCMPKRTGFKTRTPHINF